MVIVEYLDSAEAMHAAAVLKAFGLRVDGPHGRETESGDEPPLMVWTVATPDLVNTPYPERDEATDYIDSHWDREHEDRDDYEWRNRIYRGDL
jgi:hypothetical protein